MTLASLISAGASLNDILSILEDLNVPFGLASKTVEVNGIKALRVDVHYPEEHAHRTFKDIRKLIERAALADHASVLATKTFQRLAEAEGTVHGRDPEEVTFHEVGAVDSIVDIVGSCVALDLLNVESVSCGPLPMSNGLVHAAHGTLPIPAPATLEVLKGSLVRWAEEPKEMTTPTGAALLYAFTGGEFTDAAPPMTLSRIGYGAGSARFESAPNLLRAVVGEIEGSTKSLEVLEANVDDASGEVLGSALERLLDAGALDAWMEPIIMKKGRGAYKICALAESTSGERLAHLMMRQTGTLGVRRNTVGRVTAERRRVSVELPYGQCRVKVGSLDGQDFVVSPEYEDAARLAEYSGASLLQVYSDVREAFARQRSESGRA